MYLLCGKTVVAEILLGKRVDLKANITSYSRKINGECGLEDLETLMQMIHLLFTAKRSYSKEKISVFTQMFRESLEAENRDPMRRFATMVHQIFTAICS